nr:nucleotide disphospho-sugar-binding domain-containing protein [Brevibacillus fulvus]
MIRALADQPYRVLLSTNEELPADVLASLPPNIQRIRFFSAELLARARLFIHHGGHGSCMSAIMHGVPSLVIPTHSEREYNARKVWELGVGEYLLPGCFTADHLNQMATFIMEDQYRDRAIELRETVMKRKYAGAAGVYQLAERHIAQQHRF